MALPLSTGVVGHATGETKPLLPARDTAPSHRRRTHSPGPRGPVGARKVEENERRVEKERSGSK
jgi:hypothetical protein